MKDLEKVLKIENGVLVECNCDFSGDLVIPDSVKKIEDQAFCGCNNLTSVVIPDSVTEIENYAFYCCEGLMEVTIGKSVTTIGIGAFYQCSSLKTVNYNATECMSVGFDDEEGCNYSVFDGCTSLTTINIGANVKSIPESAFWDCENLTDVHYNGNIAGWCKIFFGDLHSNPLSKAHNLYINNELVTDLVIPNTVTEIKDFAFSYATGLKSVKFPDSIKSIGWSAFLGCTGLTTLKLPNSVTCIMPHAFSGCSGLATISIPESLTSIAKSTLFGTAWYNSQPDGVMYLDGWCMGSKSNTLSGTVSILDGTKGVARNAFGDCNELTSVSVPDSVEYINDYAFSDCSKLKSVTLGKSLITLGNAAFSNCSSLTEILLPDLMTEIGNDAFSGCKKLKSVVLGKSLAKIGAFAFDDCSKLASLTIPDSVTEIGRFAFRGCEKFKSMPIPASVTKFEGNTPIAHSANFDSKNNVNISDLTWSYKHNLHISFSLAEQPKKSLVIVPDQDKFYNLHDNNETSKPYTNEELDRLMRSIADYIQVGEKLTTLGGVTPGGLNLVKRFAKYGFDKIGEYCGYDLQWSNVFSPKDNAMDDEKFAKWLNNPDHKNDFKILDDNAQLNAKNTRPIVWELEKKK
ncbi:MAG: leucine-rich repeat domain-containing protein [Bacteroidales bacterium]|nr:leucine-rich repeat domain-containing protein [Bacteroidales bacterium]